MSLSRRPLPRGKPLKRSTPMPRGQIQATGSQLARTPMKRGANQLDRTPINPISDTRREENRERRKAVDAAFGPHPQCVAGPILRHVTGEVDCGAVADDAHELLSRGRGGSITDPTNIVPLCRRHHNWITTHPHEAECCGLALPADVTDTQRLTAAHTRALLAAGRRAGTGWCPGAPDCTALTHQPAGIPFASPQPDAPW